MKLAYEWSLSIEELEDFAAYEFYECPFLMTDRYFLASIISK